MLQLQGMTNYQRIAKQAGDIIAEQAGEAAFQEEMAKARKAKTAAPSKALKGTTISIIAVGRHIHTQYHHDTTSATLVQHLGFAIFGLCMCLQQSLLQVPLPVPGTLQEQLV